jgi:hypothetical protein
MDVPEARRVSAVLTDDTSCIRCGYNLRGLSPDGLCPECATPIGRSLRGDLLRFADPDWLARLRFGASLKLWNIVVSFLLGFAGSILVGTIRLPHVVAHATIWVGAALGLWATFLITAQEPRISLHEDTVTLRTAIRFCAAAGFLGTMLQPVLGSLGMSSLIVILTGGCALLGLAAWFGELVYFRRFAHRVPDPKLAKTTARLMWTMAVGAGVALIVAVAALIMSRPGPGGPPTPGGAPGVRVAFPIPTTGAGGPLFAFLGCSGGLAALFWFLIYVRVLIRYRTAFREAAAAALRRLI